MRSWPRSLVMLACIGSMLPALAGCMRRTVAITSEPSGASVTVNDVPVGRTPCEFDFTYYGTFDLLMTKPGYEPVRRAMPVAAPLYEYPPFDLAATAWPGGVHTTRRVHVKLVPSAESQADASATREGFEASLLSRARAASQRLGPAQSAGR